MRVPPGSNAGMDRATSDRKEKFQLPNLAPGGDFKIAANFVMGCESNTICLLAMINADE